MVAESLAALAGPTDRHDHLPRHLDWSGHAEYDLNRPARLASMYKVVLTEASTVDDLNTWLDADLLRRPLAHPLAATPAPRSTGRKPSPNSSPGANPACDRTAYAACDGPFHELVTPPNAAGSMGAFHERLAPTGLPRLPPGRFALRGTPQAAGLSSGPARMSTCSPPGTAAERVHGRGRRRRRTPTATTVLTVDTERQYDTFARLTVSDGTRASQGRTRRGLACQRTDPHGHRPGPAPRRRGREQDERALRTGVRP